MLDRELSTAWISSLGVHDDDRQHRAVAATTDGRTLILTRYTELNADQRLLVAQLGLQLPPQPLPRVTAAGNLIRQPAHAL